MDWDFAQAKKLIEGNYHEGEDNAYGKDAEKAGHTWAEIQQQHEAQHQPRLEQFQTELELKILDEQEELRNTKATDEIPDSLRQELRLPQDMSHFKLNFEEIRKTDAAKKKTTPVWSGQDVLPDHLDYKRSCEVVEALNANRVWPVGLAGLMKRGRFLLRMMVKSSFFDNWMTLFVLMNTVTLSMDQYNQKQETLDILEDFDTVFTYTFIFEMAAKLLAIGVRKYCSDKMNWLDGSVVLLSIFEIIYKEINKGKQVGLKAFKTMRMFRTVRVFRVIRLLRALQSMQMILQVMVNSYMSFVYITMLMFLFIFIFGLLGMSLFGTAMNYPEGLPRGNFASITSSLVTVFQILTMENWQDILFNLMRSDSLKAGISLYLIAWIFLGNFILLNLFLAILLDSFLDADEQEEDPALKE